MVTFSQDVLHKQPSPPSKQSMSRKKQMCYHWRNSGRWVDRHETLQRREAEACVGAEDAHFTVMWRVSQKNVERRRQNPQCPCLNKTQPSLIPIPKDGNLKQTKNPTNLGLNLNDFQPIALVYLQPQYFPQLFSSRLMWWRAGSLSCADVLFVPALPAASVFTTGGPSIFFSTMLGCSCRAQHGAMRSPTWINSEGSVRVRAEHRKTEWSQVTCLAAHNHNRHRLSHCWMYIAYGGFLHVTVAVSFYFKAWFFLYSIHT